MHFSESFLHVSCEYLMQKYNRIFCCHRLNIIYVCTSFNPIPPPPPLHTYIWWWYWVGWQLVRGVINIKAIKSCSLNESNYENMKISLPFSAWCEYLNGSRLSMLVMFPRCTVPYILCLCLFFNIIHKNFFLCCSFLFILLHKLSFYDKLSGKHCEC